MTKEAIVSIADELIALARLQAYCATGNEKYLEATMKPEVPCRVSADLRAKQLREDQYAKDEFNPWRDEHVGAVVPQVELSRPLQSLLIALERIETTDRSFGVDKSKAYDSLINPLKDMRDAFIVLFRSI